ncbi:MAG: twin-arginine translocase subunit TatC [Myxococcales bacterium]|nr:twin-arginine translocase subunit TatC [Myxococcales bacterium]
MTSDRTGLDTTQYTLTEHLTELRSRLLKSLVAILLTTIGCAAFAPTILEYAVKPLQQVLADRNRVETLLVHGAGAEKIELALSQISRVRYRGRVADIESAVSRIRQAASTRYPIDLVLISSQGVGESTSLLEQQLASVNLPEVAYLVSDSQAPEVRDLQLEGAMVLVAPPRAAVLHRLVRRAAATGGKMQTGDKLVVLSPLEPFFAYLKIALVCGLFLACPLWIYQGWAFIAPGLYSHERNFALPVVLSGSALFVAGGSFAYYVMFPMMFDVLINQMMPASLVGSFTVDNYLALLIRVTIAFGVVFELPLALALLAAVGLVNAKSLRAMRKYAIVGAFVLGALLTPADPLSQGMMALPLIVFYEIGIFLAGVFGKREG